jgi:hypothetical protein
VAIYDTPPPVARLTWTGTTSSNGLANSVPEAEVDLELPHDGRVRLDGVGRALGLDLPPVGVWQKRSVAKTERPEVFQWTGQRSGLPRRGRNTGTVARRKGVVLPAIVAARPSSAVVGAVAERYVGRRSRRSCAAACNGSLSSRLCSDLDGGADGRPANTPADVVWRLRNSRLMAALFCWKRVHPS